MHNRRAIAVAEAGVLLSLSLVLSYVETLVPLPAGVKLGLANIVTLFLLYRHRIGEALTVAFLRISLSALLFGSPVSFFYSLLGSVLSLAVTLLFMRLPVFSPVGVSLVGAVFHNIGQLIAAMILLGQNILLYLPVLILSGTVAGTFIGILSGIAIEKIPPLPSEKAKKRGDRDA